MTKADIKQKAIELRQQGIAITKIAKDLGCAKSSVSLWVRDIPVSEEHKKILLTRNHLNLIYNPNLNRSESRKVFFRNKRLGYQERGKERVKLNNSLYIAGCMLYWGEGAKSINSVILCNSDINILILFQNFLLQFFDISKDDLKLAINCYTDLHSVEDIENYWITKLDLNRTNLNKTIVNNLPKSSKNSKINKLEYGVARLTVCRTEIVQEIFGAIQEFGNFINKKWIDH